MYFFLFQDTEVKHRIKTENSMRHFIYSQIEEHENTFDKENIRDFVDFYWRSVKHHNELEKKYLTSITFSNCYLSNGHTIKAKSVALGEVGYCEGEQMFLFYLSSLIIEPKYFTIHNKCCRLK